MSILGRKNSNIGYDEISDIVAKDIDIKSLVRIAVKEKCEISLNFNPESVEVNIAPWKPFEYKCPYTGGC